MKIFHISDLHIGKQLHYYNLKESQVEIFTQIIEKVEEYRPDVIIIAGDIYDKSVPSGEAYEILDGFLRQLAQIRPSIPVLMIAGNHDNGQRLKFASAFLEKSRIYISVFPPQNKEEHLKKVVLTDEYGPVNFYLLPFTRPGYVKNLLEESESASYNQAVKTVIERESIDERERNVLVAHQFFVSGTAEPETCDSELAYISVGGIDSVDVECVRRFDYVALGHLHGAQAVGEDYIRYSGTPLKYSVSEEKHQKGITMVILGEKNQPIQWERIPLAAHRDVRSITGTLEEVIAMAGERNQEDYVSITLTDEDSIYRPGDQLEEYYTHILEVKVDNKRTRSKLAEPAGERETVLGPFEAFEEFYQAINAQPLSAAEAEVLAEIINVVKNSQEDSME